MAEVKDTKKISISKTKLAWKEVERVIQGGEEQVNDADIGGCGHASTRSSPFCPRTLILQKRINRLDIGRRKLTIRTDRLLLELHQLAHEERVSGLSMDYLGTQPQEARLLETNGSLRGCEPFSFILKGLRSPRCCERSTNSVIELWKWISIIPCPNVQEEAFSF